VFPTQPQTEGVIIKKKRKKRKKRAHRKRWKRKREWTISWGTP
jgi:hypothetical protein